MTERKRTSHEMARSPEYRLANHLPVVAEVVDLDRLDLEERIARIQTTLGTLITWLARELGTDAVNTLLESLKD